MDLLFRVADGNRSVGAVDDILGDLALKDLSRYPQTHLAQILEQGDRKDARATLASLGPQGGKIALIENQDFRLDSRLIGIVQQIEGKETACRTSSNDAHS